MYQQGSVQSQGAITVIAEQIAAGLFKVNRSNLEGYTPLHIAVKEGKYLLVEALLKNGAVVDRPTRDGRTALSLAIVNELPDMVEILLEHNANLKSVCKNGSTALWLALTNKPRDDLSGHVKKNGILNSILHRGMQSQDDLEVKYFKLCEALINKKFSTLEQMIQELEDVNFPRIESENPLELAVYLNDLKTAESLLRAGANPNAIPNTNRKSMLATAIDTRQKGLDMIKLLLKFEIKINCLVKFPGKDNETTPLNRATELRDLELMKLLIDHGADVDGLHDSIDGTALHNACQIGFVNGVELLLQCSADVNALDEVEDTPLHRSNRPEIAELLLRHGADVNAKNIDGTTPLLRTSESRQDLDYIRYLLNAGANLAATDDYYGTILHYVARNDNFETFKFILDLVLERGIFDVNVKDDSSCTPLFDVTDAESMNISISCKNFTEFLKNGADVNIKADFPYGYSGHSVSDHPNSSDCLVKEYVERLQFLGYEVKNSKIELDSYQDDLSDFEDLSPEISAAAYVAELDEMKTRTLSWNPQITLCDVLFMKRDSLVRYSENWRLKEAFRECSNNFESVYPYFGSVLNVQYRRGKHRRILIAAANRHLSSVLGQSLLDVFSDQIFRYLSNNELKKLVNEQVV